VSWRVAGERHSRVAAQRLSKVIETGANVLPFAPALVVPAGGGADAPEVEAEGRQAPAEADLDHAGDHRAVHITPIERVGMADDHAQPGSRWYGDAGLEGLGARADGRRPLGYHGA